MKKMKKIGFLLLLIIAASLISCSKDEDDNSNNGNNVEKFKYSTNVGPIDNTFGSTDNSANIGERMGIYFKVYEEIRIDGVHVYPKTSGTINILLAEDFNGEIFQEVSIDISTVEEKVYIPLNFVVPKDMYGDNGLRIEFNDANSTAILYYNDSDNYFGGAPGLLNMGGPGISDPCYFYFYDWQISYNNRIEPEYSTFTDSRDGRTYKTMKLLGKEWFAENLKYDNEGYYYNDDQSNLETYGKLYGSPNTVCPEGWRIPDVYEWSDLRDICGGYNNAYDYLIANGESDFNALLGGFRYESTPNPVTVFSGLGEVGRYWMSGLPYTYNFNLEDKTVGLQEFQTSGAISWFFSVRCIRDIE